MRTSARTVCTRRDPVRAARRPCVRSRRGSRRSTRFFTAIRRRSSFRRPCPKWSAHGSGVSRRIPTPGFSRRDHALRSTAFRTASSGATSWAPHVPRRALGVRLAGRGAGGAGRRSRVERSAETRRRCVRRRFALEPRPGVSSGAKRSLRTDLLVYSVMKARPRGGGCLRRLDQLEATVIPGTRRRKAVFLPGRTVCRLPGWQQDQEDQRHGCRRIAGHGARRWDVAGRHVGA